MKKMVAAFILYFGICQGRVGAEPSVLVDGRVNDLNPKVYEALIKIDEATKGSGVLTTSAAQFLCEEINADQQIDTAETDLLVEMTVDRSRLVRISKKNAPTETVTFGTAFGTSRQVLRDLLLPQKTLDSLLATGAQGWRQLAFLSERSPADAAAVQTHLQQYITALWGQSNLDNKYQPLRGFIKQADTDLQTLPEAPHRQAQAVLYQALVQADAQLGDVIPNVFYSWLK